MILTWILVGGGVALLLAGIVWPWRTRPIRDPGDRDEGEMTYLQAQNIARAQDFGFYKRSDGGDV